MVTIQYFRSESFQGMLGLAIDKSEWPTTLQTAKEKAAVCLLCNPNCAIALIAKMHRHKELVEAIKSGKITPEIPQPEN